MDRTHLTGALSQELIKRVSCAYLQHVPWNSCPIPILILWAEKHMQFIRNMETKGSLPNSCLQMFLFIVDYLKAFNNTWL